MAASYNDVSVTSTWTNLVAGNAALNNVPVLLQNKSSCRAPIQVFFGGASAPTTNGAGVILNYLDSVDGTAAQIWVRSDGPSADLYVSLKDA